MSERTINMHVTRKEAALLSVLRKLGNGYVENVSVEDGEPTVLKNAVTRIDLKKNAELEAILGPEEAICADPSA